MASPVAIGVGITAAVVFLGGVGAARSFVDNAAYTGGATGGVLMGGLPDLLSGFNDGRGASKLGNPDVTGHGSARTPAAPKNNRKAG